MTDIPAGMVAYGPEHPDYPNEPQDWDGGERGATLLADGTVWGWHGKGWATWDLEHTNYRRIIAYTPRQPTRTADLIDAGPNAHDAALGLVAGASVHDAEILRIIVAAWDRHSGGETVKPAPWLAEAARDVADHIAGEKVGVERAREVLADVHGYRPYSAQRTAFMAGNLIPIILPEDALAAMRQYAAEEVARERERCARVAESADTWNHPYAQEAAERIAAAIRTGTAK